MEASELFGENALEEHCCVQVRGLDASVPQKPGL